MRINLGSFGLFLVQFGLRIMCEDKNGKVQNFRFFRSKSSKLEEQKIQDMLCTNWSVFQKVQIFTERSLWMKCCLLYGCLDSIQFSIFKKILHGFQVGSNFWYKFGISGKCSKWTFSKYFGKLKYNKVTGFNIQIIWVHSEKLITCTYICLFVFWLLCLGHCV